MSGRCDDRRAQALEGTCGDQGALRPGQPRPQRGHREHHDADEEHSPSAHDVRRPPAEQQEASEHEGVGADDPLEVVLGEAEIDLDGGQCDVHDRDVEDHHELDQAQEREGQPPAAFGVHHRLSFQFHSQMNDSRHPHFYFASTNL